MIEIILNEEFLTFKAPLIETNKILDTNRFYSKELIEESITKIKPNIDEKTLVGEFATSIFSIPYNCTTVHYKNASHIITDVEWDNDTLIGTMQTLNTYNGNIIKPMIISKFPLKMAMRSIGDIRDKNNCNLCL